MIIQGLSPAASQGPNLSLEHAGFEHPRPGVHKWGRRYTLQFPGSRAHNWKAGQKKTHSGRTLPTEDLLHGHQRHYPFSGALGGRCLSAGQRGSPPAPYPHRALTSPWKVRFRGDKCRDGNLCAGGLLGSSNCKEGGKSHRVEGGVKLWNSCYRHLRQSHKESWNRGTPFRGIPNRGMGHDLCNPQESVPGSRCLWEDKGLPKTMYSSAEAQLNPEMSAANSPAAGARGPPWSGTGAGAAPSRKPYTKVGREKCEKSSTD